VVGGPRVHRARKPVTMPPRAHPGDPEAIRAALSPGLRASLDELRTLFDLPPGDGWTRTPLGPVFTTAAVLREVQCRVEAGTPGPEAVREAARHLGVSRHTVDNRLVRWFLAAHQRGPRP
jgi:hypothetical protein